MSLTIIKQEALPRDEQRIQKWQAIVSHTHHMRSNELDLDQCHSQLVNWCQKHNVHAIGVGSPWEPVSRAHYAQYEGPDRDLYYSGKIDPQTVKDEEHVHGMIADLNHRGCGHTHFYLDNETPKQRYGHIWWFGWDYDFPAWHDYSQDRHIHYYDQDPHCEINQITGLPHRRRCYLEIVAAQRAKGALAVWAHPTSWWYQDDEFITNIAAECGMHLFADGYLDGYAHMGYNAIHRAYNDLWFHLLDTGATVPGFAETDNCHNQAKLMDHKKTFKSHMPIDGDMNVNAIKDCARKGHSFSSTGAFCELFVDGTPMGSICETNAQAKHAVELYIWPVPGQNCLSRVEFIGKNGEILDSINNFAGGRIECTIDGSDTPHYLLIRAYGEHDDPQNPDIENIEHGLVSNPVYMHPKEYAFKAVETNYTLSVAESSQWLDGTLQFETASGELIEKGSVKAGKTQLQLPAGARVQLHKEHDHRQFYIAMENVAVQKLMQYIWNGEFLKDHPDLCPGELPPSVFKLSQLYQAMESAEYSI